MAYHVSILKKRTSEGKLSLYLNWTTPVQHPVTGAMTRRKFLGIRIPDNPTDPDDRLFVSKAMKIAQRERNRAEIGLLEGDLSFLGKVSDKRMTLLDRYDEETELRHGSSNKGWKAARVHLEAYITSDPKRKVVYLDEVDGRFLDGFKTFMVGRASHNTAARYNALLRACLNASYRKGLLSKRVTEMSNSMGYKKGQIVYLTRDELDMYERNPCNNALLYNAAMFSAYTGLRISDVEKFKLSSVVPHNGRKYIVVQTQKTGEYVYIPLSEKAQQFIDLECDPEHMQFRGLKGQCYGGRKKKALDEWTKRIGIKKHVTFHAFRRTFATALHRANTPIKTISKLLGHSRVVTTEQYIAVTEDQMESAIDSI